MSYANSAHPDQTAPGALWSGSTQISIPLNVILELTA